MMWSGWRSRFAMGASAFALAIVLPACTPSAPAPGTPPAASTEVPAATPAAAVTLIEPTDNTFSGHVDMFRWSAADGADGYVVRILGSDGRVVFESPVLTETEVQLPTTVAFEPEAHTWSVTARKGGEALVASPVYRFTITP